MIFVYDRWEKFLKKLKKRNITSIPAKDVTKGLKTYLVLKHDVETNVRKSYEMAKLEKSYNHCGTYYVQAYLLNSADNVKMLSMMQKMGHEISYHYDVMDSNKGDIDKAKEEFEKNKKIFESNGFKIHTVCQHGNPIVERVGYTSNRDFFRDEKVREEYSSISDIMVNYKIKHNTDYKYFSDAGRRFKLIYDPINNDVIRSEDKDICFKNLDELSESLSENMGNIISIHPHRWAKYTFVYIVRAMIFTVAKFTAKTAVKNSVFKKIISKYYYIAKKI